MIITTIVQVKEPISKAIKRGWFAGKKIPKKGIKTKTGQVIYYEKKK